MKPLSRTARTVAGALLAAAAVFAPVALVATSASADTRTVQADPEWDLIVTPPAEASATASKVALNDPIWD